MPDEIRMSLAECKCGNTIGLSNYGDRLWCPGCLMTEIDRLRRLLDEIADALTKRALP